MEAEADWGKWMVVEAKWVRSLWWKPIGEVDGGGGRSMKLMIAYAKRGKFVVAEAKLGKFMGMYHSLSVKVPCSGDHGWGPS